MALVVAAHRHYFAGAAFKVRYFGHAKAVPGDIAAEGIGSTDTGFDFLIHAAGARVILAAVAVAGAAFIGFTGTQLVPGNQAAELVNGADTFLNQLVLATGGCVGDTATPLTFAAVGGAIAATLAFTTSIVTARIRTLAAIGRTGLAVLTVERLTGIVTAALPAIAGAGLAVLVVVTVRITASRADATVLGACFAALQWAAIAIAALGTDTAVLRAVETGFGLDAKAITAAASTTTVATAILFDFGHADVVPGSLTAVGIKFANADLNFAVGAAGAFCGLAAAGRALAAIGGAALAALALVAEAIATFGFSAARQATLRHRFFDADIIPHRLAAEGIKRAGTCLHGLVGTPWALLNGAAIATQTAVVRAGLAGLAFAANAVAAVTANVLAANTGALYTEIPAGASIAIVTSNIRKRRVEAPTIGTAGVFSAVVTIVAAPSGPEAKTIDADIGSGACVTVIADHTVALTRHTANTGGRIALAYFALAQTIVRADH